MPENLNHQSPPTDQPPDPAAARAAAREARRRLAISGWPLLLHVGLASALAMILMLLWPASRRMHGIVGLVWVVAVMVPMVIWPAVTKRVMRGRGYARAVHSGTDWSQAARAVLSSYLVALPLIAANVALTLEITSRVYWMLICAFLLTGFMVMALLHHLWEFLLISAIGAAMGIYLLAFPVSMPYGYQKAIYLGISLAGLLLGTSFFLHWRKWFHSLPHEDGTVGTQEAKP